MSKSGATQPPVPDHILQAALDIWEQTGGQHEIPITGDSMLPLIQEGDRAMVQRGWVDLRWGDVIVFRSEDGLVAHRVMRTRRRHAAATFITKGDHVLHLDPPVRSEEVVGRVVAIRRGKQLFPLDTYLWRLVGRLIVVVTFPLAAGSYWARKLKQRVWGTEPHPLTTFLRRGTLSAFAFCLKMVTAMIWRKHN